MLDQIFRRSSLAAFDISSWSAEIIPRDTNKSTMHNRSPNSLASSCLLVGPVKLESKPNRSDLVTICVTSAHSSAVITRFKLSHCFLLVNSCVPPLSDCN